MMEDIQRFLGKWSLVSDRSAYDLGEPPQSGTYEILADGRLLTFKMNWVDSQGNERAMDYSEVCDGNFHNYPVKAIADEICLTLRNSDLLESIAKKNDKIVMTATRELVSDHEMKVTMSGQKPDGDSYSNVAWYVR